MAFTPLADQFFLVITWLGSLYILVPCTVALDLFLLQLGKGREALLVSASLGLTIFAAHSLKLVFKRPRPDIDPLLIAMPTGWSFPSAHTAQAAAFFLALAVIASRNLSPQAASLTTAAGILITLAVGYSRVYLQVHYVSDVLAGMFVAGLAVFAVTASLKHLVK
jgi:membrane-associated phospholipid phosphatase